MYLLTKRNLVRSLSKGCFRSEKNGTIFRFIKLHNAYYNMKYKIWYKCMIIVHSMLIRAENISLLGPSHTKIIFH